MGRASVGKVSCQTVNEVADRCDVQGGMKTRYGGAPGEVQQNIDSSKWFGPKLRRIT